MQALEWSVPIQTGYNCVAIAAAPALQHRTSRLMRLLDRQYFQTLSGTMEITWSRSNPARVALARMVGHLTYMSADKSRSLRA